MAAAPGPGSGFDEQRMLFSLWRLFKEQDSSGSGKISHAGLVGVLGADVLLAADVACRAPGLADSSHWLGGHDAGSKVGGAGGEGGAV